ncbi:MAG: hypothetical protein JO020_29940 [Chloroflexi bacterium]|nr:hypothetical protein [Chloroflexota bacterium]MBV9131521.1 hypothetical protein [Chloroflexota bacterium]MBV9898398.1 hypothetical protein [Chloroflexota bacterium]
MNAALRRLVVSKVRELAPHNIRVNASAPGFIDNRLARASAMRVATNSMYESKLRSH